jgi:4-carboxymuconolactone decarboxylase
VSEVAPADAPRIDPLPEEEWDADVRALIDQNWSGDPPGNRNNLYRTLARHPELFRVWSEFGRAVLNSRLPARDRELLVLRIAWLTRCRFEWAYHEPLVRRIGMTSAEIDRVVDGPDAPGWDKKETALLMAVDELHATGHLGDAIWQALRGWYGDQELIEIPVIVGQYQLVAYLTNTLMIAPDPRLPSLPTTGRTR